MASFPLTKVSLEPEPVKLSSKTDKFPQIHMFEVKPATFTIDNAHSAPKTSPLLTLRVNEVDPDFGKAGVISSDWRFKTA